MIDIELHKTDFNYITDIGDWLDKNIPNPPLGEEQLWTIGYSEDSDAGVKERVGIRFQNETDAVMFRLRWG